jgi:hypothetical protein
MEVGSVGGVVGALLPLAVVVAVSPVPIIAVVLMLLTPRAGGTGAGLLVGWIVGIAGVTTGFLLLAGNADPGGTGASLAAACVELVLGGLLLALAVQQRWARAGQGGAPESPPWLSAVNPKVLLVCVAAGLAIAGAGISGIEGMWSVVAFTVVAASTVAVPVLAYAVGGEHVAGRLESLRGWLTVHGRVVTPVLLLVVGVVLVGQGLAGLV